MSKYPEQSLKKEWVQSEITDEAVEWTKSFGEYLTNSSDGVNALTTSQIRKFFGELKRIQSDPKKFKEDIPMLKAKLAYAVGRDIKNGKQQTKIKKFYSELESGINLIRKDNDADLIRFIKIVESTVAFHKYFGGKDK